MSYEKRNAWLAEVKAFQSKYNCTYKEALKGASLAREHGLEGEGVLDYIRNLKNVITNPSKELRRVPKEVSELLNKVGNERIAMITICRSPLRSFVKKALSLGTRGDIDKAVREEGYDNVFHLYMIVTLHNNTNILLERNQRVVVRPINETKCNESINIPISQNITLRQLLERGEKANSSKVPFYVYDPVYNNCQRFVNDILRGNNLETSESHKFIMQDATKLVKSSLLQKIGKSVTDIANLTENIFKGGDYEE